MTGFSNYVAQNGLNWLIGLKAQPVLPAVWQALFTAVGLDDGTGFTEATGNAYARIQVAGAAAVNGVTAAASPTLNFAAVPAWITAGMTVWDLTATTVIPAGTTVLSKTATTVTMSANAAGAGVGATDVIAFSAFGAAAGTGPANATSSAAVTFAQSGSGGGWGTLISFGLFDALSAGNLLDWDYLGAYNWLPATISAASPAVLTAKAHGYAAADSVIYSLEYGGTAPAFSQSTLTGTLAVVSPATDTFTVTNAATAVNTSSTGSGNVRKIAAQATVANMTLSFAAGQLILTSA